MSTDILEKEKVEIEITEPKQYRVIMHNDDRTSMDFVTVILMEIFHKSHEESVGIMLAIHNEGSGVAGVYDEEVAEMKTEVTTNLAKAAGFPLVVEYEEDS